MGNNTVQNLPNNMLYQFDKDMFVWKIEIEKTRGDNYHFDKKIITEVYELNNKRLDLLASGRLIENKDLNHLEFSVFDYDKDDTYTFKINMPIARAPIDKVYLLRDAIERRYSQTKKR